eukprot:COSAG02_NODE_34873_length_477_cov_0.769841_1_plen_64_part_10
MMIVRQRKFWPMDGEHRCTRTVCCPFRFESAMAVRPKASQEKNLSWWKHFAVFQPQSSVFDSGC